MRWCHFLLVKKVYSFCFLHSLQLSSASTTSSCSFLCFSYSNCEYSHCLYTSDSDFISHVQHHHAFLIHCRLGDRHNGTSRTFPVSQTSPSSKRLTLYRHSLKMTSAPQCTPERMLLVYTQLALENQLVTHLAVEDHLLQAQVHDSLESQPRIPCTQLHTRPTPKRRPILLQHRISQVLQRLKVSQWQLLQYRALLVRRLRSLAITTLAARYRLSPPVLRASLAKAAQLENQLVTQLFA